MDTILHNRSNISSGSAVFTSAMGLFLTEWDGLSTSSPAAGPVLVLGATNRPEDIDPAFRRRMPVSIETRPPSLAGRVDVLRKLLRGEAVEGAVDLEQLARRCEGATGSDLRELVRAASAVRARELMGALKAAQQVPPTPGREASMPAGAGATRALGVRDFEAALNKMQLTGTVLPYVVYLYTVANNVCGR